MSPGGASLLTDDSDSLEGGGEGDNLDKAGLSRLGTSQENIVESEGSDTENDDLNTVKQRDSPNSSHSSLDRERQEDLDIFGLPPDYYARFEEDDEVMDEEFYFDKELRLDSKIEDEIVAAELLRPERLDTVEEVSEPPSSSSLPHDGCRYPEQFSQHTSITSNDPFASLTSVEEEDQEQVYSVNELEFRNSLLSEQSLGSLPSGGDSVQVLRSQLSDDRTLAQVEQIGRVVGLNPDSLTYVRNPFEIFSNKQDTKDYSQKVQLW